MCYDTKGGDSVVSWNPWHGCHKISVGCFHCYMYRQDAQYKKDSSFVLKTKSFDLPLKRNRKREYKISGGEIIYTCFTSDFFIEEADEWRKEAWKMIRKRGDLQFLMITKRIDRFYVSLPEDWGDGYKNVTICCTVENQDRADYRLPIYLQLPIQHKCIVCEPILEEINLMPYLNSSIQEVIVGGESGQNARICEYQWVLSIRDQCISQKVSFHFKQTGAYFKKDGRIYHIPRKYQHSQAKKAGIDSIETNIIKR